MGCSASTIHRHGLSELITAEQLAVHLRKKKMKILDKPIANDAISAGEVETKGVLIDVKEAASHMGIAFQTLESGLKNHLFTFGTAVPGRVPNSYRYIIFRECFMRCLRHVTLNNLF